MSTLLQKHPEILNFKKDRFIMAPAVSSYISEFKTKYSTLSRNLQTFRQTFSAIETFNTKSIEELKELDIWTHTKAQYIFTNEQLQRIAERYPVPQFISSHIKTGGYLDLRNVTDHKVFYDALNSFARKVSQLPNPSKVKFDIDTVGHIPLQLVHNKESKDFIDPLIGDKLNTIWTLDGSYNPGVSIKDVMAKQMVEDALQRGTLTNNKVIVEGTSGNTGAGLAIVAAYYGIKTILVMPDKMSQEKIDRLRLLGAHVVVTPTDVTPKDPKSYYTVRDYISQTIKGWRCQQYDNLSNRKAHEEVTGPRIWEETEGKVTSVVVAAGTCGTISGIGRYLKNKNPGIKIIAVDTVGSILYLLKEGYTIEEVEEYAQGYTTQGFGEDIHPQNLDLSIIDYFIRVSDLSALTMTRILPSVGFIAGHSSGAVYAAAIDLIAQGVLKPNDKTVVIFPDVGVPYRKDVYNDSWLKNKDLYYQL